MQDAEKASDEMATFGEPDQRRHGADRGHISRLIRGALVPAPLVCRGSNLQLLYGPLGAPWASLCGP